MRSNQFNLELMRFRLDMSEMQIGDEGVLAPFSCILTQQVTVLSILGLISVLGAGGFWRSSCFHESRTFLV